MNQSSIHAVSCYYIYNELTIFFLVSPIRQYRSMRLASNFKKMNSKMVNDQRPEPP